MLPSYITHYYLPDRVPFLNLSGLDDHGLGAVLAEMREKHRRGELRRQFTPDYVAKRKETEIFLRSEFIKKGGKAPKPYPHYFVLGVSNLFKANHADMRQVCIPLDQEKIRIERAKRQPDEGLIGHWETEIQAFQKAINAAKKRLGARA